MSRTLPTRPHDSPSTYSFPDTLTEARSEFLFYHRFTFLPWLGNMVGDNIKWYRSACTLIPAWDPSMFPSVSIVLSKLCCSPCAHRPTLEVDLSRMLWTS